MKSILNYLSQKETIRLIVAVIVAITGYYIVRIFLIQKLRSIAQSNKALSRTHQRLASLERLAISLIKLFFTLFFLFTVFDLFGLDVKALALSAGIAGLAVSFGTQSLVKDLVTGFFMLLENQISLGDYVKIASEKGVVFSLTSRVLTLLTPEGSFVYIPFGSITSITNYRDVQRKEIETEQPLLKSLQSLADKAGMFFQVACDPETRSCFFYFNGIPKTKDFDSKIKKLLTANGFDFKYFSLGTSRCFLSLKTETDPGDI